MKRLFNTLVAFFLNATPSSGLLFGDSVYVNGIFFYDLGSPIVGAGVEKRRQSSVLR